jgi:hypothetical protein
MKGYIVYFLLLDGVPIYIGLFLSGVPRMP